MKTNTLKIVLSILLIFALAFSFCFELIEIDHDCCGEHCAICAIVNVLKSLTAVCALLICATTVISVCKHLSKVSLFVAVNCTTNLIYQKTKQTA